MESHYMQRQYNGTTRTSDLRRARTLAGSLAFILVGAALYANNVSAATPCGAQADFLVKSDPLLAPVRPVDCSTVFQAPPAFSWPAAQGAQSYTVSITFPDGRVEEATTATNWLAWPVALPAGEYRWTVSASGRSREASLPRTFTVDASAAAFTQQVSTAASQYPSSSHGSPTLDSAAQLQATSTAWTSLRAAQATSNNWDAARRECVDVPGTAATAVRLSSCRS
jgi:hypothetical protein